MPVFAHMAGVEIVFYHNKHPPPDFPVKYAEQQAVIDIASLDVVEGFLPVSKRRIVREWRNQVPPAPGHVRQGDIPRKVGTDRMSRKLPRIKLAEPVIDGILKLDFLNGYEGVVNLRPLIANRRKFELPRLSENFSQVRVDECGHSISWMDESGYDIDLGADSLRRDCERQAEVHKLMTA